MGLSVVDWTWKRIYALCLAASFVVVCGILTAAVAVADDPEHKHAAMNNDVADLTSEHGTDDAKNTNESLPVQLTTWLSNVEGGFFNPKQEIRAVGEDGGRAFHGIFAKEFIAKGDLLSQIPWEYIITDEEVDPKLSAKDFDEAVLKCGTARNLAREMKQVQTMGKYVKDPKTASKYGPYIQYLLDQPLGVIPSEWSTRGKNMLNDMLGGKRQLSPPNYVTTWLTEDWYDDCKGDPKDEISTKAAMLVVSRGDDDLLVPVYDMYNHRNGVWYNTHMKVNRGMNYQVTARKDIQPGEQIYNSYNMCDNCGGRKDGYGTPEIFRDYGFVENFPQRWNFEEFEFMFDLFEKEGEGSSVEIIWVKRTKPSSKDDIDEAKHTILKELKRLRKIRHLLWRSDWKDGKSTIPANEWNNIWEYHQALIDALSYAYNDIVFVTSKKVPVGGDRTCTDTFCDGDYFDTLEWEKDEIKYNQQTCDNKEIMTFPDYYMLEGLKTHYQELNFAFRQEDGDICMDLEDTVQICSTYRPHYHEFSSHFAARFVDVIKRVVFVGGGDSMMLHEVLKYPSLEKVVGLELDQTVVRKSFKYFRTQAHFDDDRVEWWFGDATKSLLLLPKDYWGSFDLVIVDLSETVMAFSVTEELDVFDALALLLNPDGVMVKNEHYMESMSETFDYTLQVYLDQNPKICSQCMIFGSNRADFFRRPLVEHNVETLLLPKVESLSTGYEYFHDFRKNDAVEQKKCNLDSKKKKEGDNATQSKSAGLLHILDAEDVTVTVDEDSIKNIILSITEHEGLTPISADKDEKFSTVISDRTEQNNGLYTVVFKEGYVSVRYWPEYKYCAVDVGIWGSYERGDRLRKHIGEELKTKKNSYFRVVVGGMYGSSTWQEDKDSIGPQIVQQRNCEESKTEDVTFSDNEAKNVVLDEAVNIFSSGKTVVGVFCGVEGVDECLSLDVLEQHIRIEKVVPIWTCPKLSKMEDTDPEKSKEMNNCEGKILTNILEAVSNIDGEMGIAMFVIDGSTPRVMGQIFHSILTVSSYRDMIFKSRSHYVLTLSNKPISETWQRNMLDRYRKELFWDPAKRVEIKVNVGGALMELGILSYNDLAGFENFKALEQKISKRLPIRNDVVPSAEVTSVTGALFPFMHDFSPHEYVQEDYPLEPGNKQWAEQKSFGRKIVLQYDFNKFIRSVPDLVGVVGLIESTVSGYGLCQFDVYTDVGDGVLIVTDFKLGNLIVLWNGREHIDLNIFLSDDSQHDAKAFLDEFAKLAGNKLKLSLRDDFPRGIGRVMNFRDDMSYKGFDSIFNLEPYVDQEDDEDE